MMQIFFGLSGKLVINALLVACGVWDKPPELLFGDRPVDRSVNVSDWSRCEEALVLFASEVQSLASESAKQKDQPSYLSRGVCFEDCENTIMEGFWRFNPSTLVGTLESRRNLLPGVATCCCGLRLLLG